MHLSSLRRTAALATVLTLAAAGTASATNHSGSRTLYGTTDQNNAGVDCGHHNREKHRRKFARRRSIHGQSYTIRPDGSRNAAASAASS